MSEPLPPRLVLDQELLARLGPQSRREDWERTLKRTGLASVQPGPTRAGKLLSTLQRGVAEWPTQPTDTNPELRPFVARTLVVVGAAALFGSLFLDGMTSMVATALPGLAAMAGGAMLWPRHGAEAESGLRREQRHAELLADQLRSFLSLSFVEAMGTSIVEQTPHMAWLQVRQEQLAQALARIAAHREDLEITGARIRALNLQLGRAAEDEETQQLRRLCAAQTDLANRVEAALQQLRLLSQTLEERLERRRAWVERQALSARTGQLAELEGGEALAEAELDVLEMEGTLKELALEEVQEDLRIRALLEVAALQHRS